MKKENVVVKIFLYSENVCVSLAFYNSYQFASLIQDLIEVILKANSKRCLQFSYHYLKPRGFSVHRHAI